MPSVPIPHLQWLERGQPARWSESERGGKTAGNPRDDNSSSRFSSPYLSLSAIDANGRSDSPVHIRFPPFFPPSQPRARTRREVNWILAPFPFPLPRSSLPPPPLLVPLQILCMLGKTRAINTTWRAARPPMEHPTNADSSCIFARRLQRLIFPPRHPLRRLAERVSSRAFIRHTPRTR